MASEYGFPVYPGWNTVRRIGSGSYGAVFEIERDLLGSKEKAALKVISIPKSESDVEELYSSGMDKTGVTEHFKAVLAEIVREYRFMADIKGHTNIVYCNDIRYVQKDDGIGWDIYIRMELLTPLMKAMGSGITEEQVVKLGMDICQALIVCSKRKILHRDIKPQNIFISDDGDYKLGDFGVAKTAERTSGGTRIGTYNYMAPEVFNNQPYGHSSDVYSLGLVMYWMLNERRMPFCPPPPAVPTAEEMDDARRRRFEGEDLPAPLHGSAALKRIVLKACSFDVDERYSSAEDLLQDLNTLSDRRIHTAPSKADAVFSDAGPGRDAARPSEMPAHRCAEREQTANRTGGAVRNGAHVKAGKGSKPKKKRLPAFILFFLAAFAVLGGAVYFRSRPKSPEASAGSAGVPAGSPYESAGTVPAEDLKGSVIVYNRTTEKDAYDPESGETLILRFSYDTPTVIIEENPAAAEKINEFIGAEAEAFYAGEDYGEGYDTGFDNMLKLAEDNFYFAAEAGIEDPLELSCAQSVSVLRNDGRVLTLAYNESSYTGGAHGVYSERTYCFDPSTGEKLTLDTISDDPSSLKSFLTDKLVELARTDEDIQERTYGFIDPDAVSETLGALLREGSWYFDCDGMVIFSDLYEISSYAAGIVSFRIPYSELQGYIHGSCLPAKSDASGSFRALSAEEMTDGSARIADTLEVAEDGQTVWLRAEGQVEDVRVSTVAYSYRFYDAAQLWSCSAMEDSALRLVTVIPDGMPNLKISWRSADGEHACYLTRSGEDGSLILLPVEGVDADDFTKDRQDEEPRSDSRDAESASDQGEPGPRPTEGLSASGTVLSDIRYDSDGRIVRLSERDGNTVSVWLYCYREDGSFSYRKRNIGSVPCRLTSDVMPGTDVTYSEPETKIDNCVGFTIRYNVTKVQKGDGLGERYLYVYDGSAWTRIASFPYESYGEKTAVIELGSPSNIERFTTPRVHPDDSVFMIEQSLTDIWVAEDTYAEAVLPLPSPPPDLPRVTKNPSSETVKENGKCQFVTRYENAELAEWHFVSPDGLRDLDYIQMQKEFPSMKVINGFSKDLTLENVPKTLNGWHVYCQFGNTAGVVFTAAALITVT